ncbi:hypothetical protein NE237_004759 [Protea cynaroides]|uniref:Uncharacterized protein n=1 Tax=Protea cynaroides TaxID=273540 RepID=A0A9Q0KJK2_9MAGN|nr:hypothetical protein NE237_004759 [Protea cynaroides]
MKRGLRTELARGWDSFTCIPASTTKSSGLNAPTTAVQPFLGFVESGFPFTHNGGAAPTRQAATGHNALFAQQIHFDKDTAPSTFGMRVIKLLSTPHVSTP